MQVKIEKLVFGGQGLGRADGQVIFVWGGLPGETVEIKVIKKKKNFVEGVVEKIITASPDRIEPKDSHYLTCSPWQVIPYEKENEWKKTIAAETYERIAGLKDLKLEMVSPDESYGYRNKMEYNFVETKSGPALAFHNRGTHYLSALESCVLASPEIQKASAEIVGALRLAKVPASQLKSLIVRSNSAGEVIAALYVNIKDLLKNYPAVLNIEGLRGFAVFYSNPLSPASEPTELLYEKGECELSEKISGVEMKYGIHSFFQINPPVFESALKDIAGHLSSGRVVDYYSGVGAIALPLHDKYKEAVLVEENTEAAGYAEQNIKNNNLKNVRVLNSMSEDAKLEIGKDDTVIFDPPRTGLHKNVIVEMLKHQPKKIIYLSCGLDTHARDISFLSVRYKPVFWKLYNFFPRTPHIEGLCVLERKG